MNEDEIEVIKNIKLELEMTGDMPRLIFNRNDIECILKLIEKQQKEIEELNKSDTSKEQSSMNYYNLYKELEDKIKAKIEELNKEYKEAYNKGFKTDMVNRLREIKLLQSLLEKE